MLALMLGSILMLPLLANQDGPLHVFYAHVFQQLLSGHSQFASFYAVRSVFPPYSLHLYLIILLTRVLEPVLTERVVACLEVLWVVVGFARLIRALNKESLYAAFLVLPFAAGWTVYMGFSNFTFGLGSFLFAVGYWLDHEAHLNWRDIAVCSGLVFVLAAMHPVTLFFFFTFTLVNFLVQGGHFLMQVRGKSLFSNLIAFVRARMASVTFLITAGIIVAIWMRNFVDPDSTHVVRPSHYEQFQRFLSLVSLNEISPFTVHWKTYSVPLAAVFGIALLLAIRGTWLRRTEPKVVALCLMTLFLLAGFFIIPQQFNRSFYANTRFSISALFLILAMAGLASIPRNLWKIVSVFVVAAALLVTVLQRRQNLQNVSRVDAGLRAPLLKAASRVEVIKFGGYRPRYPLRYDPAIWAVAYWCSRSDAVLIDRPWMDLPIYPIKGAHDEQPIGEYELGSGVRKAILDQDAALPFEPDGLMLQRTPGNQAIEADTLQSLTHRFGFQLVSDADREVVLLAKPRSLR